MKHFVYIALCDEKTYYVGSSNNPKRRLKEHKHKKTPSTRSFADMKIIYTEEFDSKAEASKREFQIKKWSRAKKAALVKRDFELLKKLSRNRKQSF